METAEKKEPVDLKIDRSIGTISLKRRKTFGEQLNPRDLLNDNLRGILSEGEEAPDLTTRKSPNLITLLTPDAGVMSRRKT